MLSAEQMRTLKKVNISEDPAKTKSRISEDFKTTTNSNKKMIVELSGLKRPTFYRVFDTGAATARVVLSMAHILGVSPDYYTGEVDEKTNFSEDVLMEFLEKHKYSKLVQELKSMVSKKAKRQPSRKVKSEFDNNDDDKQIVLDELELEVFQPEEPQQITAHPVALQPVVLQSAAQQTVAPVVEKSDLHHCEMLPSNISLDNSPKMLEAVEKLDEESAAMLLKALYKRAEAGENAKNLCDLVKRCLLS